MSKPQRRRVLLRCDANPQLGLGHVARCQALAGALHAQGADCILIGPERQYQTSETSETSDVFRDWIPHPFGGAQAGNGVADAESLAAMAKHYQADWLVLDDYRVNEQYQHVLRAHACRWLQFDGASSQTLWADVVLNSSPAARAEHYQHRVSNVATQLLLGPRYAILRAEFAAPNTVAKLATTTAPSPTSDLTKRLSPGNNAPIRIYLNFGGGDDRGALRWCADTLLDGFSHPLHLKLVSGQQNPNNPALAEWAARQGPRLEFLVNPPQVAAQMRECDLAILSGGMSCYEADACGLPMLLLPLVPNQLTHARAWAKHGRAHLLEAWPEVSPAALRATLLDCVAQWERERAEIPDQTLQPTTCPQLTDGLGAQRVAEILMA